MNKMIHDGPDIMCICFSFLVVACIVIFSCFIIVEKSLQIVLYGNVNRVRIYIYIYYVYVYIYIYYVYIYIHIYVYIYISDYIYMSCI